ncbi:MAG: DUF2029 domain-containing protein [Cyanobacteria bacterium SZAS TMP-1]|nr:DUF2029 domain-containing protein [Cyanobacteria bacterium SZAS TMP-1]
MSANEPISSKKLSTTLLFDILFLSVSLLVGIIFLNQTVGLILKRTTVWAQHNGIFEHLDFVSFYSCGMMMLTGQAKNIYDTTAQLAAYNQVISPASVPYTNFLQHVPYVFSFLPLLALMPLRTAYVTWSLFSAACAFIGTAILRLRSGTEKGNQVIDILFFGLLFLSSLPGNFCLLDGQLSWFYFVIISFYCWAFMTERHTICGISLALLSIKPQYFVFLLLPQIVLRRKKTLLVTGAALGALIALAIVTVGWENVLHYPQILWHGESTEHFALERPKTMISIRSVLSILLPNRTALLGCAVFELIGIVATFMAWRAVKEDSQDWENRRDCLVFTLITMLVVSAHFYLYEGVLLATPALLALPSWRPSVCVAAGLMESKGKVPLYLLLLFFPLANLAILLLAPTVAAMILPQAILDATEDNGIKGNLLMYETLFLYNVLVMAAAMQPLIKLRPKAEG